MPGILSKRILEDIRSRSDIADVVSSYLQLKRSGSTFKTLCPFHKEKTPSFHVNPQRQIFHCFGCGAGGDVFKFVMMHESMDFMSAVRLLAERAGIRLEFEEGDRPAGPDKNVLYKLHVEVADIYHRGLLKSPAAEEARNYLKSRSLPEDIIREFQIGYAPDKWDTILGWAQKKGYTTEQIEAAGLIVKSDKPGSGDRYYDRFRHRIMFPIRDEQGRVIAFSGRALEKDAAGAKYVNSPETPLFRKSHVLYALDKARHTIVETRQAILCEGQIDVIRCHAAGFKTAVASQGTAFTDDHARALKRYADEVVLVFDPDRAGEEAAIKTAGIFMQVELAVRVARLPAGEDPDAFILRRGAPAFAAILKEAKSVVDFQIAVLSSRADISTESGQMQAVRAVLETIGRTPNKLQQDALLHEAAKRFLNQYPGSLRSQLDKILQRSAPREAGATSASSPAKHPKEEVELAEHVVAAPELAPLLTEYLPFDMISDPLCRAVIEAALEAEKKGVELVSVIAEREAADGPLAGFAAQIQMAPLKISGHEYSREDAVKGLILNLWRRRFKRRIAEVERLMETDEGKIDGKLRAESAQLRRDIKRLSRWDTGWEIIKVST